MANSIEDCLKKFVLHVDQLKKEDDPGGDGFSREFRELRELQTAQKNANKFPAEEGKRDCNIKKNRYKDILPYDTRRVVLKEIDGVEGSDYINASFIEDVNGRRGYIASQGPLPHTVNDFWRMLWQYKVEIVFMVCREEENNKQKCHRYWTTDGESKTFGDFEITTESEEEVFPHFIERKLCARCGEDNHRLTQFHYTGWPDHNVPKDSSEIYKMVGRMREERRHLDIPLVIHCSAGCGRTGTICAVDFAWTLLDHGKIAKGFSMYEIIKNIREQRQSMVQTPDQYEFVHLVVQSLAVDWLNQFQEHDYSNMNFGEENEEMYYNTSRLPLDIDSTNAKQEDIYEAVFTQSQSSSLPEAPKKPELVPKPVVKEMNNNKRVVTSSSDGYENTELKSVSKTGEQKSYENVVSEEVKKMEESMQQKAKKPSSDKKKHAPDVPADSAKPGHTTKIMISSKPQTPAKLHGEAVKTLAQKERQASSGESTVPQMSIGAEAQSVYTEVKREQGGKLEAYPKDQLQVGAKKKGPLKKARSIIPYTAEVECRQQPARSSSLENHVSMDMNSLNTKSVPKFNQQNHVDYENYKLPVRPRQMYENFSPQFAEAIKPSSSTSSTEGEPPPVPEKMYGKDEAIFDTVIVDPDKNMQGMVRAQGGLRPAQQGQINHRNPPAQHGPIAHGRAVPVGTIAYIQRQQGVPLQHAPKTSHVVIPRPHVREQPVQVQPVQVQPSASPFGTMRGLLKFPGQGRKPPQQAPIPVNIGGQIHYMYRGNDIAFPHRVPKKAGGKRQPSGKSFSTYL